MRKIRLRPLPLAVAATLTLLTLVSCAALKLVTDIMADRAEHLIQAVTHHDRQQAVTEMMRIEQWSRTADYIAWSVGAVVIFGCAFVTLGLYFVLFHPMFGLSKAMREFTAGDRNARAQRSVGVELDAAALNFNNMADIIVGQHAQMTEFLRSAAQELRDPVQVIRVALKAFVPGKPLPPDQLIWTRIVLISREVNRLERLVETYLDAGRVEWQRLDLQLGRNDLGKIVHDAAVMYQAFSPVHQVVVSVPPEPMCAYTNPVRVAQVVHTLVANAIQQSPKGGVVEVVMRAEGDDAVIGFIDHGVGIPQEEMKYLFEPFKNITAEHAKGPGSAVALSVAKRIAEAHGGHIEVSTKIGEGSTFRVRLPLAKEPEHEEREKKAKGREAVAAAPEARAPLPRAEQDGQHDDEAHDGNEQAREADGNEARRPRARRAEARH
jgi:signal transduction histidine kinase